MQITREEFQNMIENYGHHMSVRVPVTDKLTAETIMRTVLNNGMPYNPYGTHSQQMGMSSNMENAKTAMSFVKRAATVYSNVFQHTTGDYTIID